MLMGTHQAPLAAVCCCILLGTLVTSSLGQARWGDSGLQVILSGTRSKCQGQLEVLMENIWRTICSSSWDQSRDPKEAWKLCQQLGCREPLNLAPFSQFNRPQKQILCYGPLGSFSNCSHNPPAGCLPLSLVCMEPQKTTPPPTSMPPTTTPEPTAPPRLQLVAEPGGLQCAGMVVFYSGSQGGTILYETQDKLQSLGTFICNAVQCGSFLTHVPGAKAVGPSGPGELRDPWPLTIQWEVQNWSCTSIRQCFRKIQTQEGGQVLSVICSDFQPKVQSRLVGGGSVCEGTAEVRQGAEWAALCDSPVARGSARWEELCQEQQCGSIISFHTMDASGTSHGFTCPQEKLSQCHELHRKAHCRRVFVTCQDPNPAGLAPGTVASIILTLVLLIVLLVICGPLAYKKLVKKFRHKKQRQWIGPTRVNQSVSFHRNHTATVRSQAENPTASHVDNEYSQPPRNSYLSAYPALEGALHRSSAQPDNSSDSDYDLHVAQRL